MGAGGGPPLDCLHTPVFLWGRQRGRSWCWWGPERSYTHPRTLVSVWSSKELPRDRTLCVSHMRRFFLYIRKKRNGQKNICCEVCRRGQKFPETGKKNLQRLRREGKNPYPPLGRPGEGFWTLKTIINYQARTSSVFFVCTKKKRLRCGPPLPSSFSGPFHTCHRPHAARSPGAQSLCSPRPAFPRQLPPRHGLVASWACQQVVRVRRVSNARAHRAPHRAPLGT